jgi:hypothetical protein
VHSAAVIEALARELKEERFLQPGADRENATLFLSFPYVCPEPVLVK